MLIGNGKHSENHSCTVEETSHRVCFREILRNMLKEINKKIDVVNRREGSFEKKLDNVDKRLGGLIRQVNRVSCSGLIELPS